MKFATILTLVPWALAVAIPEDVLSADYANAITCGKQSPAINTAIEQFCEKNSNGLVIPSDYATNGYSAGGVTVKITGDCSPAQWVPFKYCMAQFHAMCVTAPTGRGYEEYHYGWNNKCQAWYIGIA